jgi:hypothetical protein
LNAANTEILSPFSIFLGNAPLKIFQGIEKFDVIKVVRTYFIQILLCQTFGLRLEWKQAII